MCRSICKTSSWLCDFHPLLKDMPSLGAASACQSPYASAVTKTHKSYGKSERVPIQSQVGWRTHADKAAASLKPPWAPIWGQVHLENQKQCTRLVSTEIRVWMANPQSFGIFSAFCGSKCTSGQRSGQSIRPYLYCSESAWSNALDEEGQPNLWGKHVCLLNKRFLNKGLRRFSPPTV